MMVSIRLLLDQLLSPSVSETMINSIVVKNVDLEETSMCDTYMQQGR